MSQPELLGIFGGTFDPIHNGHINSVMSLIDEILFTSIYLLPSSTPPHRAQTSATAADRLKMVELAIMQYPQLKADDRESSGTGKSYTIDTLKSFRSRFPTDSLAFIAGMDAYLEMPSWKQWRDYLDYAHIIVMARPGYEQGNDAWGKNYVTHNKNHLLNSISGKIYYASSTLIDISATAVRERLKAGRNVDGLLPDSVINYIDKQQLYDHTDTT